MTATPEEVTQLLVAWGEGDRAALDRLVPLVYRELHKLAKRYMAQEEPGDTLQTTALIHEAYLKLAGGAEKHWENRAHFFGVAAKAMRHVVVDQARARQSAKRGGEVQVLRFEEGLNIAGGRSSELIALDDALTALAELNPRQSEIVELRYFAGLSVPETAAMLNVSPETVMRDWKVAKAFLYQQMKRAAV